MCINRFVLLTFLEAQKFTAKDVEANAHWWSHHMTPQQTDNTNIDYEEK